jgi:uncharacterized repeat protein (TIGR01451 family)
LDVVVAYFMLGETLMKVFFKSRLALTLIAFLMVVGVIAASLGGWISYAHAQAAANETFAIAMTKTTAPTVTPGGTLTYTLIIKNISPASNPLSLHDLHVKDLLPPGLTNITAQPTFTVTPATGASVDCPPQTTLSIVCTIDDFNRGAVVTITFSAKVDPKAKPGQTIANVTTAQSFTDPVNATASAKTRVVGKIATSPAPCKRFGVGLSADPCPEGLPTEKELIKEFGCEAVFVPIGEAIGIRFGIVGIVVGTISGVVVCEVIPVAREVHLLPSSRNAHGQAKKLTVYMLTDDGIERVGTITSMPISSFS